VISPLAGTQIDGALAQDVAGISAYVMWHEALYAELGAYRSAKQGVLNPITGAAGPLDGTVSNVISGAAPYGRVPYEYQLGAPRSGSRCLWGDLRTLFRRGQRSRSRLTERSGEPIQGHCRGFSVPVHR
jgi:hypothetical protein